MLGALIPLALSLAGEFIPDLIGGLAGKNAQKIAEKVVGTAEELTGQKIETEADVAKVVQIIKSDAELQTELKMQLSQERLETARIHSQDRISARTMAQKTTLHAVAVCVISCLVVLGFGTMLWLVLANPLPEGNSEIVYILLGTLSAGFSTVLTFWLGSSRSSQDKSQMMSDAARK
jgi:hypothetical protein